MPRNVAVGQGRTGWDGHLGMMVCVLCTLMHWYLQGVTLVVGIHKVVVRGHITVDEGGGEEVVKDYVLCCVHWGNVLGGAGNLKLCAFSGGKEKRLQREVEI